MKIIVGLGNPEKDYKGTRHNIGFEVVNNLSYELGIPFSKAKYRGHLGEGMALDGGLGQRLLLLKPNTFMNLSGECVRDVLKFYKLGPEQLIVIYDDCDIALGDIKIRERGGAGGHNGVKNIIYQLETDEFVRVRVGIGMRPPSITLSDYVLSRFAKDEADAVDIGIRQASAAVLTTLREGSIKAMNKFN